MYTPLRALINGMGEEELRTLLSSFSCRQDSDIELFLHERAVEFEKLSKSRTYLIFNDKDICTDTTAPPVISGYISLSLKVLKVPEDTSNRKRKELDGLSAKLHGKPIEAFPCYLIGQLARNSNVDRNAVSGAELLNTAHDIITSAVSIVGGRYMMIECADNEKLIQFYRSNGFIELSRDEDSGCGMVQMIRMIDPRDALSGANGS